MELNINDKNENTLLNRTEVRGILKFEGTTPSNVDVAQEIAKQLKSDINLVVMKHIYTKFSHQEAVFHAYIYKDVVAKVKSEKMTKHLKKKAAAEAKQEEAKPVEEKKVEEPVAEEKKEEVKESPAVKDTKPEENSTPEEIKEEASV